MLPRKIQMAVADVRKVEDRNGGVHSGGRSGLGFIRVEREKVKSRRLCLGFITLSMII